MNAPRDCVSCPFTTRCMSYYGAETCHFYCPSKENVIVAWVKQLFGKVFK